VEDIREKEDNMFKFELGEALEETDTGFQGFVVARAETFSSLFDQKWVTKIYLLYDIPEHLPFSSTFEEVGERTLKYGWYDERNLTRVGRKMRIE